MTIGIDADGILFDYIRTCAKVVNDLTGMEIGSYERTTHFDNLKAWGVSYLKDKVDFVFEHNSDYVYKMPTIEGAHSFMDRVRSIVGQDYAIITSCPASWHVQREHALWREFAIPKNKVHFSRDKSLFNVSLLVDDYHGNFRDFNGWRVLLDHPWNQNTEGIACQRCMTHDEVVSEINRIVNWKA